MKTIAFFNNKGGVGKTSLVYHLAWMFSSMSRRVIVADLDPQANLTGMFKTDDELEALWQDGSTAYTAIKPLLAGVGDIVESAEENIAGGIHLISGDIRLSEFEDDLSQEWPRCMDGHERSFRVETAFARLIHSAGQNNGADYALIDIGPNLGAINRAALIACDHIITPLGPDLFSLQGLQNLGPTLNKWRNEWRERKIKFPKANITGAFFLPEGGMSPLGYVMMRHTILMDRPVQAYNKWIARMPGAFRKLLIKPENANADAGKEQYCLAELKDFRSLMPLAQLARKPMFDLKTADGAIGAHLNAVGDCYKHFKALAEKIIAAIPPPK